MQTMTKVNGAKNHGFFFFSPKKIWALLLVLVLFVVVSLLGFHQHVEFFQLEREIASRIDHSSTSHFAFEDESKQNKTSYNSIFPRENVTLHHKDLSLTMVKTLPLALNQTRKGAKNSSIIPSCFPHNSVEWLQAGESRLGNYYDPHMKNEFVQMMIGDNATPLLLNLANSRQLLEQSLCHKDSNFLSLSLHELQMTEILSNETLRYWTLRLMYFAIHIHQHRHATEESRARSARFDLCHPELQARQIGVYDYECPSTKFLVIPLGPGGLGAVMRLGMVNGLMAGVATNRTVLFVNNAPVGPNYVKNPWMLASCPRRDMQCFFLPTSPCVLTTDALAQGKELTRGETRSLFKLGRVPDQYREERVLFINAAKRPQRTPPTFRSNLRRIIMDYLIDPMVRQRPEDPRIPLLKIAADDVMEVEPVQNNSFAYFGSASKFSHAFLFYAMRPNIHYATRINQIIQQTVPGGFDPNLALGLPIRASDKCEAESECLSFEKYMVLMGRIWNKNWANTTNLTDRLNARVIVTSEARSVHLEQERFEQNGLRTTLPFAFEFINNDFDHTQSTGNPLMMQKEENLKNISMDELMLSAVSSLKLQLHARYTVGNCCSNFHLLLFDFLRDGCSATRDHISQCLQDDDDPEYRLCCQWSKREECLLKRNATKL